MNILKMFVRYIALKYGKYRGLYVKICRPTSVEYAGYMRQHGGFHRFGKDCSVNIGINVTDPPYVSIGNNVSLSACTLLGHDGIVRMLEVAYNMKLDSVGKIDIRDNSFVGHGAIVMPGVTIGPNSVVAAGAVVCKDVPPGVVVGGIPAKPIGKIDEIVRRLKERTDAYPWVEIIRNRNGAWDPSVEAELVAQRVRYFYPE